MINTKDIKKAWVGASPVKRIWLGTKLVRDFTISLVKDLSKFPYAVGFAYNHDIVRANYVNAFDYSNVNTLTPETALNPGHVQPNRGQFDYTDSDKAMAFADARGIRVHGAHLTWHTDQMPTYYATLAAANPGNEKAVLTTALQLTISTVVGKYKGRIKSWNVTNEMVYNGGGDGDSSRAGLMKECEWSKWFTLDEFVEIVFTSARAADPAALLFSNDYTLETSNEVQSDVYIGLNERLKAKNIIRGGKLVKIDGLGLQVHTGLGLDMDVFRTRIRKITDAGMYVFISELDTTTPNVYTPEVAEAVAKFYYDIFENYDKGAYKHPELRWGISTWSATDRENFMNRGNGDPAGTDPITDFPVLFDWYGNPKLAYTRVLSYLDKQPVSAKIYQDFEIMDPVADLNGSFTGGTTPKQWVLGGTDTAANIQIDKSGLSMSQTSKNVYNFALINTGLTKYFFETEVGTTYDNDKRVQFILVRYVDANNYIAAQSYRLKPDIDSWRLVKKVNGVDTILLDTGIAVDSEQIIKVNVSGTNISLYIDGVLQGTKTVTDFQTSTTVGFKMRGYDDKFTSYKYIKIN